MATIINGRENAKKITEKITLYANNYTNKTNIIPNLAVILAGENKASKTYVQAKISTAQKCGFAIALHKFDATVEQNTLLELIDSLNTNSNIHGILVQLPLPPHINSNIICQAISPIKDVDGFTYANVGKLWVEANANYDENNTLLPCTPLGIFFLLAQIHGTDFSGLDAVIVGRSNIVGKPIAGLLLAYNATITIVHSKTKALAEVTRSADILIVATGQSKLIKKDFIKKGATIIDVGVNYTNNDDQKKTLVGDVDFHSCKDIPGYITPVPGGVGPMTIAMLMYNTLKATCIQTNYKILKLI